MCSLKRKEERKVWKLHALKQHTLSGRAELPWHVVAREAELTPSLVSSFKPEAFNEMKQSVVLFPYWFLLCSVAHSSRVLSWNGNVYWIWKNLYWILSRYLEGSVGHNKLHLRGWFEGLIFFSFLLLQIKRYQQVYHRRFESLPVKAFYSQTICIPL